MRICLFSLPNNVNTQEETTEKKQRLSDAHRTQKIVQGSEEDVNAFLEEDNNADVLHYDDMY